MLKSFITLLFILPVAAWSQNNSFNLQQSIDYALKNSPLVSNAHLDVEIAKKKVYETTALGLPQVNGEVNLQNLIDIPTQVIPANAFNPQAPANELMAVQFGTKWNSTAALTASQLLFDGSYIVGLQASKTYKALSEENLNRTQASVREQVSQAYHTAVLMEENLAILRSSLENVSAIYEETNLIFEAGMIEEQDVEQLALTRAAIENMLSRTSRQASLALDLLKINMGMPLNETLVLSENAESLESSITALSVDTSFHHSSHYDFRLAATNAELMKLNLKRERFGYLPSLGAFITHSQNAFRNDFDFFQNRPWYPTTIWGVNLSVPIFDSGLKGARIGQARMEYEKSMNLVNLTQNQLTLQASARRADLQSAIDRLENEKENRRLAQKIYDKTLIKYKEGLTSSLDLSQAQNQLINVQGAYINSVLETLNARVAYQTALGK